MTGGLLGLVVAVPVTQPLSPTALVARTRTEYSVPSVRPPMVWLVSVPVSPASPQFPVVPVRYSTS